MTKTYGAINPQQIIDLFEMRAKIMEKSANLANTRLERDTAKREIVTWRAAADILRNTEFVGWTHESRIVDEIKTAPGDYDPAKLVDHMQKIAQADEYGTFSNVKFIELSGPSAFLSLDDAKTILAALERPQAVESARSYMEPRERHAAAITAMRAAINRAEK